MNERRVPIGVLAIVPMAISFGLYAFTTQEEVPDPSATPDATATVELTVTPGATSFPDYWETAVAKVTETAEAVPLTPAPSAVVSHGPFHDGASVRVNAGAGDCLNARNQPALDGDYVIVYFCLPHGFEGMLSGDGMQQEGHWWWYIAGAGWVAEDWLEYVGDVDLRARTVPSLTGRVAFFRGNDLWLMDGDGSAQRLLVDAPEGGDQRSATGLHWSPDGSMLSYTVSGPKPDGWGYDLHVVTVADGTERVFPDVSSGLWSPDGVRLGVIADVSSGDMGSVLGKPAVLDPASGAVTLLVDREVSLDRAPEFNFDGSLLLLSYGYGDGESWVSRTEVRDLAGDIVREIVPPEGTYFGGPRWSPVDSRIAMRVSDGAGSGYGVYDVDQQRMIITVPVPAMSTKIGGRCGSADPWPAIWSRDGRRVYHDFDMGDTNANGVWAWDLESGVTMLIRAASASRPTPADGSRVYFSVWAQAGQYIFAGDAAGGFPVLITDGREPVWAP